MFDNILAVVKEARKYYLDMETERFSDNEFASMMLLDACFIMNHMEITLRDDSEKDFATKEQLGLFMVSQTSRDLVLMENQILNFILQIMVKLRDEE